ncbi:flavodoxin-like fold protein [Lodderomyces elongisporus]|uniref:flavodoxin-like fold protein n=1 Tax=Lodderomyces elongisporus TaxID=36914 RepID=UPI00291E41F2|nr:flavodoxin-like fold protein [Lodderomyces elongisporus]WLF79520.1 flavodoxin-like fold protein [Lodderomyces elongisporus]
MSKPKVAIVLYSLYHHVYTLAESAKVGVERAGVKADLFQVKETLSPEILKLVHAKPKLDLPEATNDTLTNYDAFLFGIPTRYGNMPAQWKSFWDGTGGLWAKGALRGKHAGVFVSTGTQGGGQETTVINTLSTLAHHGIIYVPFGYGHEGQSNLTEIHGGSPWGAGTFAAPDGSRQVTDLEKAIAEQQGHDFVEMITKWKQ